MNGKNAKRCLGKFFASRGKKEEVVGGKKMFTIAADEHEHERLYIKLSLNTTNNA